MCPNCKSTEAIDAQFDGSQTYIVCHNCPFDALYGDGDQREEARAKLKE